MTSLIYYYDRMVNIYTLAYSFTIMKPFSLIKKRNNMLTWILLSPSYRAHLSSKIWDQEAKSIFHKPFFICSNNAHNRIPMTVSLTKFLRSESTQPPESFPVDLCPTRSRNLKSPESDTRAYITPFIWPFPITPTTLLLLFTALLRFRDQARYWENGSKSVGKKSLV